MKGKILYGAVFTIVLPLFLITWAIFAQPNISLPTPADTPIGLGIFVLGFIIQASATYSLIKNGEGLPMNGYPPKKFVFKGLYKFFANPIYIGASLCVVGLSWFFESSAGLWLVSPVFILSVLALIFGFESQRTRHYFGEQYKKPLIGIPTESNEKATAYERLTVFLYVVVPWLVLYEAIVFLGIPNSAFSSYFPFEKNIPIIQEFEIFYLLAYPFTFLIAFALKTKSDIRECIHVGLVAMVLGFISFLCFPIVATPRPFHATNLWGNLIQWEASRYGAPGTFPSFHIIWALVGAYFYSKSFPKWKLLINLLAFLIILSCLFTGVHSILDAIAAYFAYLIAINRNKIWHFIQIQSEKIANSWKEWTFGPIRIINHGFYVGAGTFFGALVICLILGPEYYIPCVIITITTIVGAGLWAQYIEGSDKLKRPFGFYGGLIGACLGAAFMFFAWGVNYFAILAAVCVVGPWVQLSGRFRCLVQGCCHGCHAPETIGIRYYHEKSRVSRISGMMGEYLYPTQVYSMLSNVAFGLFLARLWWSGADYTVITGVSIILNSIARFVEEAYRGEVQTPVYHKLRMYQWTALASLLLGAIFTCIPGFPNTAVGKWDMGALYVGLGSGAFGTFLYGIDFPKSNRRFSRLV